MSSSSGFGGSDDSCESGRIINNPPFLRIVNTRESVVLPDLLS
jgi:hypothetical protein